MYFMRKQQMQRIVVPNKAFLVEVQSSIQSKNRGPHCCYLISKGTMYLVYTTNKCFLFLHLMSPKNVPNLPFDCIDLLREIPEKKPTIGYKTPPSKKLMMLKKRNLKGLGCRPLP